MTFTKRGGASAYRYYGANGAIRSGLLCRGRDCVLLCAAPMRSSSEATDPTARELIDEPGCRGMGLSGGHSPWPIVFGRRRTNAHFRGKPLLIDFWRFFLSRKLRTDLQAMDSAIELGPSSDSVRPAPHNVDP